MTLALALSGPGLVRAQVLPDTVMPDTAMPKTVTPDTVTPEIVTLSRALMMAEVMAVLREEGLASGAALLADTASGAEDPVWRDTVSRIYDTTRMEEGFQTAMAKTLAGQPEVISTAIAFFGSELGQRALRLELEARRALVDKDVEATAGLVYEALAGENPARQAQLDRFVAANDLVESNVMGALNANLAFLRGMVAEGESAMVLSEAEMVEQVWASEPEVRAETETWLFPFLNLAYQPLTDAELQAYIDFSETAQGKALNAAMFQAFDKMFDTISHDLGRAFARQMQGQDI